jgi:flagellar biosynthesis/type III secretory pathway protein FliH
MSRIAPVAMVEMRPRLRIGRKLGCPGASWEWKGPRMGKRTTGRRAKAKGVARPSVGPSTNTDRLQQELAEARAQLDSLVREGADAFAKQRIAELEEARLVARGQALEAAAARARAEAELRALNDAIARAPGLRGRLLRWAAKRVVG